MNCKEVIELMQRDLDDDLNELEKKRLETHLDNCPSCAKMFYRLSMLSHGLEQLPKVEPVYSIVDAILPRVESLEQEKVNNAGVIEGTFEAPGLDRAYQLASPKRNWKVPAWGGWVAAGIALMIGVFTLADQGTMRFQAGEETTYDTATTNKSEESGDASSIKQSGEPQNKKMTIESKSMESDKMDVAPAEEKKETMGIKSAPESENDNASMSFSTSSVGENRMPSPNGTWIAVVSGQVLHIENDRGEIVYSSTFPRETNERVVLTMWSEDGKTVYYEVTHINGTFSQWEIQMETWIEKKVSR